MEEIRERLIDAAGNVFADRGYRAATIREICQAAEANVAAVNYYFGDKQRLYIETVKAASRHRASDVPFPEWSESTPADQRLHDFLLTIVTRMLGRPAEDWESRLMLREILHPTEACRELAEEYLRPVFETLLAIIRDLGPNLSEARCRQIGLSIMGQCLIYRAAGEVIAMLNPDPHPSRDVARLAAHIADFSLAALGHAPPLGEGSTNQTLSAKAQSAVAEMRRDKGL